MSKVLIVDDEEIIRKVHCRHLTAQGHQIIEASDGLEALALLGGGDVDVIISDLVMPGMDGLEFLRRVRGLDLDVPVIFATGSPSLETAVRAVEYGAFRYLEKPVDPVELAAIVLKAAQIHELARLKRRTLEWMGDSARELGDRAALESRFDSAVAGIRMAFQPIISLRERRVVAYEALVRTTEPTLARPDHLLDAADRLGRLLELGRCIRAHTADAAAGGLPHDCRLFVNLHVSDLNDEWLTTKDGPLGVLASRTTLEITERTRLDAIQGLRARVESLRQLGFKIAVDDLGAGYAGLSAVSQLDPEVIKLDMSLIRGVEGRSSQQRIIGAMAQLCRQMGIELVAEGVETTAERDALADLGCDLMQGWLYGKASFDFAPIRF